MYGCMDCGIACVCSNVPKVECSLCQLNLNSSIVHFSISGVLCMSSVRVSVHRILSGAFLVTSLDQEL